MKEISWTFAAIASLVFPCIAQAQSGEGRRISEASFTNFAGSERGWIDQGGLSTPNLQFIGETRFT